MSTNRKPIDSEDEDDFGDIDDNEISDCLNNERQVELKSKIWELMHGQYLKRKRELDSLPPDNRKKAKADSRKSEKTAGDSGRKEKKEDEKARKMKVRVASLSSKINFEALKQFTSEEDGEDSEHNDKTEGGEKNEERDRLGQNEDEEYGGEDGNVNEDEEYESDRNSKYDDDCELY
ncbi:hypothetical protein LINPERHAP1_LOCUS36460 [Linum perenne]